MPKFPTATKVPPTTRAPSTTEWPAIPLTIFRSVAFISFFRADQVLQSAGATSQWTDLSGFNRHVTQGTAANMPAWSASDAAFGGKPSITFDGVNDSLDNATDYPWAAVSATFQPYFFGVMRQITWTINATPWTTNNAGSGYELIPQPASPQMAMFTTGGAVVNANSGLTIGSAALVECWFNANTTDFLRCGASTITGASAGPGASTTILHLGTNGAATQWWNGAYAECGWLTKRPTDDERAAYKAYALNRYGSILV